MNTKALGWSNEEAPRESAALLSVLLPGIMFGHPSFFKVTKNIFEIPLSFGNGFMNLCRVVEKSTKSQGQRMGA